MGDSARAVHRPVLAKYEACHDEKTVDWLNSEDLQVSFGFRRQITVESHRAWIESAKDTLIWSINDKGFHVGNVLLAVTPRHRSAYFQMYIGERSARGKGLGDAAVKETLVRAFEDLNLHRVWLHAFADNVAAEALYRKHGFVFEGVERDAIWAHDRYLSQNRWSLLALEWREKQSMGCEL